MRYRGGYEAANNHCYLGEAKESSGVGDDPTGPIQADGTGHFRNQLCPTPPALRPTGTGTGKNELDKPVLIFSSDEHGCIQCAPIHTSLHTKSVRDWSSPQEQGLLDIPHVPVLLFMGIVFSVRISVEYILWLYNISST